MGVKNDQCDVRENNPMIHCYIYISLLFFFVCFSFLCFLFLLLCFLFFLLCFLFFLQCSLFFLVCSLISPCVLCFSFFYFFIKIIILCMTFRNTTSSHYLSLKLIFHNVYMSFLWTFSSYISLNLISSKKSPILCVYLLCCWTFCWFDERPEIMKLLCF